MEGVLTTPTQTSGPGLEEVVQHTGQYASLSPTTLNQHRATKRKKDANVLLPLRIDFTRKGNAKQLESAALDLLEP
jgi:hypothetical protein